MNTENFFSNNKSFWRPVFDTLLGKLKECGEDIEVAPTGSYLSILKSGKEFAVIQVTPESMDIGIKLKDAQPSNRFEASGSWNLMMTHRVRINEPRQVDKELIEWLRNAYNCN